MPRDIPIQQPWLSAAQAKKLVGELRRANADMVRAGYPWPYQEVVPGFRAEPNDTYRIELIEDR